MSSAKLQASQSGLIRPIDEDISNLDGFTTQRLSVAKRLAIGKALRNDVPRAHHAHYSPKRNRVDCLEILERQNATRVQKLVPLRFARMLASPFAFLRGSAAVMTADLATTPISGLSVTACGDMHVANFGVYASAERNLVFGINDFDETHPGPWEWDVKRLAASAAVAARFMGADKVVMGGAARAIMSSYRERIRRYADMGWLEVWYDRIDERSILNALSSKNRRRAERVMAKARQKGHIQIFDKLTERVAGEHRIIENAPLIVRETHTESGTSINVALDIVLRSYRESLGHDLRGLLSRYRIVDTVRKVVGVGSVGTACWVALLKGVDDDDPLFLQVKQAQASVLEPYSSQKLPFHNNGQRVVVGQRLIQGSPDIFLGWSEVEGKHYYVRQLADMKGSIGFEEGDIEGLQGFTEYCALCGWALALAHAKSGDPAMIAGYCGKSAVLDDAIAQFALTYASQTEHDYEVLVRAKRAGRIQVASG